MQNRGIPYPLSGEIARPTSNAIALSAMPGDWTDGEFDLICELNGRRRIESLCDRETSMWGNRLGWIISAMIVVLIAVAFAWASYEAGRTTPLSEFSQKTENFDPLVFPGDPRHLLTIPDMKNADGGPLYWAAIKIVRENPDLYEGAKADLQRVAEYTALEPILEAAHHATADIFRSQPDAVVKFGKKPAMEAIDKAGTLCLGIGIRYARQNNFDQAQQYLNASYILGLRLFQDRQCRAELDLGMGLMGNSATNLAMIAGAQKNDALQKKLKDFNAGYLAFDRERVKPLERVISSIDPKVSRQHVGDVFKLAQESREKVWQLESILRLGMYRFNSPLAGDRRAANRMIREFAKSEDLAIRSAAMAARDLTVEDFRRLGTD